MCAAAAVPLLEVDVAIVGGGMVGASLAAALAGTGRRLILIESAPFGTAAQPSFDERTTALGNVSRRIFEGLAVWESIAPEAAAIRNIHVSEAGRFGFARLAAPEQGVDAVGRDRETLDAGRSPHDCWWPPMAPIHRFGGPRASVP